METYANELLPWKFKKVVKLWFEKDNNLTKTEFNNDWIDPYDSIWLKLLTVTLYTIEIFESLIMITFVNYETAGYFGHYRTLINQLLSHLYGGVSIFLRLCWPMPPIHTAGLDTIFVQTYMDAPPEMPGVSKEPEECKD